MALSLKPSALAEVPNYPSVTLVKASWCGHCKRFAPEYNNFAESFGTTSGLQASNEKPLVTQIDAHKYKNELQNGRYVGMNNVRGFPTTLFFKGDGQTYEVYQGPRTAEGLRAGWNAFQQQQ
jgi:thiol-disulfide isomerase/thioredoxin